MTKNIREKADKQLKIMKWAFSGTTLLSAYIAWIMSHGSVEDMSEEVMESAISGGGNDLLMGIALGVVSLASIGVGVWFSIKARKGDVTHIVAMSTFVAVVLFATVAMLIISAVTFWIVPAAVAYAWMGIWLVVPSNYDATSLEDLEIFNQPQQ